MKTESEADPIPDQLLVRNELHICFTGLAPVGDYPSRARTASTRASGTRVLNGNAWKCLSGAVVRRSGPNRGRRRANRGTRTAVDARSVATAVSGCRTRYPDHAA